MQLKRHHKAFQPRDPLKRNFPSQNAPRTESQAAEDTATVSLKARALGQTRPRHILLNTLCGVPTFTPTLFECRDTEDLTHLDT